MQRLPARRQATVNHRQYHGGGKRGRSGTGLSSPVTGSQALERADSNVSAVPDGEDGWTTVKRRRGGKRQTGGQSEKLAEVDQTREWSGVAQQQVETEVQPVEPFN